MGPANKKRLPPCTDAGNAEFFGSLYTDKLRFDHRLGRWLIWNDHWWREDIDGELVRRAKQAARIRLQCSAELPGDEERPKQAKWAVASESRKSLEATLALAKAERPIADPGTNWDADPWLFGVTNGVIDLRTGKLRPGTPDDKVTLHSNLAFDPSAQCHRWDRFLSEIFDGDLELITFVHRAIGYSLSGDTSEQCFFCCYGDGANGKTTFLNAVRDAVGTYACNLPFSAFELKARSAISNDVATLPGRRFITAVETDESARLNEARIKALTGGDPLTARLLYRELFTFIPVGKFWLAFNHSPTVADDSHGFWRRVHLIPFARQFDPRAEPELERVLRVEAPGILAWAVRGCLEWRAHGLNPPAAVKNATQAYRDDSDPLRDFVSERCILHPDAEVTVASLWLEYRDWSSQNGEPILKRPAFTRRLVSLGLRKVRCGHSREWTWLGVCRTQDADVQHLSLRADAQTSADANLQ